ncbi:DNA-binding protein HU-beta [hydrothermal vent metagenome]|uniref:DNA-binding protein HU-beta n=1 Tax=hydrothermal vent metagenome TaxID=652676 RepID=A0A3B0ZB89_9ZZZZ
MNKTELFAAVAEASELTSADAAKAVNAFAEVVTKALSQGDTVTLPGFGAFSTTVRAARTGRNPRTGEPIEIAESIIPKFKAGKGLKDQIKAANS